MILFFLPLKSFNQKALTFSDLKFGVYKGNFRTVADIEKLKPTTSGNVALLNWNVSNAENEFAVKYVGKINVPEAGKYTFTAVHGGNTQMKINGKDTFKNAWLNSGETRQTTIELPAGDVDFERNPAKEGFIHQIGRVEVSGKDD